MLLQHIDRIKTSSWLTSLVGISGGLVYLIQSWFYAHTQISILDEGAYLLKGYLFATGKYQPFQDYGPWTNHMPFSFLIPGWAQVIFGPGLRTGRYLTIAFGGVMLLGIWVISRRLGNRWWAVASVWLFAFNAPAIKIYSVVNSQGLVACMLVWILVLVLGPNRPVWQVNLGVVLAAVLLLTRINMTPVLPLVLVYIFWQHGIKTGIWASVTSVLAVGIGHAFFWPEILKLWAVWSPINFPFLNTWKLRVGSPALWNPEINFHGRILSFLLSLRVHFTALAGILGALIMWPPKQTWRTVWRFRAAVFLGVSFMVLFAIHAWASLGKSYCVYCLPNYMMFFHLLGILFVCVSFSSWNEFRVRSRMWLPVMIILGISIGVGYSLVIGKQIKATWIGGRLFDFVNLLWHIEVPRIREMRIEPGSVELWGLFANKLGGTEKQIVDVTLLLVLLLIGCLILYFGGKWFGKHLASLTRVTYSSIAILMIVFLSLGTALTLRIGYVRQETDCGWNVISTYEAVGAYLAKNIPPGSKIYWRGGKSAVPLLYLNEYKIYPPQINGDYSYFLGGNPDILAQYGMWNVELDQLWLQDADVILIESRQKGINNDLFDEITPTPSLLPCNNSVIHVYIRK
jgi:hypothetical protein